MTQPNMLLTIKPQPKISTVVRNPGAGTGGATLPIAGPSLLGNNTNANATPSALTPSQVVSMLDVPTNSALAAALTWANIASKPSTFAPSAHTHTVSDLPVGTTTGTVAAGNDSRIVNALSVAAAALAYSPISHTHSLSQLTQSGATSGQVVAWNGSAWVPTTISSGGGTWGSITGTLSAQSDLNTALNARLAAASNLSDLANAAASRTNLGLGNVENAAASGLYVGLTGAQTIAGAKTFSGTVSVGTTSTFSTSNYTFGVGTFVFQPYAQGNALFAENAYYNGTNWQRINSGYATIFQLYQGQLVVGGAASGTGVIPTQIVSTKIDHLGVAALGGTAISMTVGNYTGASLVVSGSLATFNVPIVGTTTTFSGNGLYGNTTSTSTGSPVRVSLGGTYGNSTPGSYNNLKWQLYDDGTLANSYGIGMSPNLMEFQAAASAGMAFYTNRGVESFKLPSGGGATLNGLSLTGALATSALAIAQTWNTTGNPAMFTLSATNTASGSTSKLISCSAGAAGATEVFYVDKNGMIAGRDGGYNSPTVRAISGGYLWLNGNTGAFVGSSGATALNWDANNGYLSVGGGDTNRICADAGDVTALRRGTNAQTFRFYSTYADGSNYGRGSLSASSTAISLAAESLGTGPANVDIVLTPKGTGKVNFSGTGTSWVFDNSSSGITRFMYGGGTNSVYQADWSGNFTFQSNIKIGWSYIAGAGNTVDLYFAREGANSLGAGVLGVKNNSGTYAGMNVGILTSNFQSLSANPSTVDLTASQSRLVKNTTSGVLSLWANDGGTMKSAPLT